MIFLIFVQMDYQSDQSKISMDQDQKNILPTNGNKIIEEIT